MSLTDNEIIKALECCKTGNCDECPFYGVKEDCEVELPEEALNLANRLKAEIERLQSDNVKLHIIIPKMFVEAKTEAIKEFADRLKGVFGFDEMTGAIIKCHIDNLVKEMVGD